MPIFLRLFGRHKADTLYSTCFLYFKFSKMTDQTKPQDSDVKPTELEDSTKSELEEKADSQPPAEDKDTNLNDEVEVELNLDKPKEDPEEVNTQKLKSAQGQIDSYAEKIKSGELTQDKFEQLPEYIQNGLLDRHADLFEGDKEPVTVPDTEAIAAQAAKKVEDDIRFKELKASLPKKMPKQQLETLNSELKFLVNQGMSKADALERSMVYAGVNQAKIVQEARKQGIKIAQAGLPPAGEKVQRDYASEKALDEEFARIQATMAKTGVNFTREMFNKAKSAGEI